jgi:hypothetical protein
MKELEDFFNKEFPDGVRIMTPQFERTEQLDFQWKPSNYHEFITTVTKAPWDILKGFGFRKWDTMNNVIGENKKKPVSNKVSIPFINKPDENLEIDCGRGDAPIDVLEIDEDIILFPSEWYSIIPDGFIVTGLHGEQYPFEKDKTDDDMRFGCLAYGIRRPIN